jgi:hypothetical protein
MRRRIRGAGSLLNSAINALPFELHLVGYNYCGPGTKLQERLARGDKPINPLDEACQEHDIAYSKNKDIPSRLQADRVLADKAWKRYKSKDVPWGEKIASWLVTTGMNTKTKIGGRVGIKHKKTKHCKKNMKKPKVIPLTSIIKHARLAIRGAGLKPKKGMQGNAIKKAAIYALRGARKITKNHKRNQIKWMTKNKGERVLPLPKTGGVLPLLPIFAGLSAIGSLAGGAAGVVKTVGEIKDARRKLEEMQRHNKTMEAIALRQGKGLYLKPYKKGLGLYMTPYMKQAKNL